MGENQEEYVVEQLLVDDYWMNNHLSMPTVN